MTDPAPLATLSASSARRLFGYGVVFLLGALMIYLGFISPSGIFGRVFLLGFGALVLVLAERMRRATLTVLTLTEQGIYDSSGRELVALRDVVSVQRGAFAFKPSNGFSLILKTRHARAWVPGMWWRAGHRLGVGGVTAAGASKFMAERIAMTLNEHN